MNEIRFKLQEKIEEGDRAQDVGHGRIIEKGFHADGFFRRQTRANLMLVASEGIMNDRRRYDPELKGGIKTLHHRVLLLIKRCDVRMTYDK